jgi:hypothetical protein
VRFPAIDEVVGAMVEMTTGGDETAVTPPQPWVADGQWVGPE